MELAVHGGRGAVPGLLILLISVCSALTPTRYLNCFLILQEKAAEDKQRAQKERADAGLGAPAARKATKSLAACKTKSEVSYAAADDEAGQEEAANGGEAMQAPAAKGALKTKVQCSHMALSESKFPCAFLAHDNARR